MSKALCSLLWMAGMGIVCLSGAQAMGRPPWAKGFTEDEMRVFASRQETDVVESDWGKTAREVSRVRLRFPDAVALSDADAAHLASLSDPSLDEVAASGAWTVWRRIILFIPDRILDAVDMVSGGVGVGPGIGGEVHVTRWASLGLGVQAGIAGLWYYNRNLAIAPVFGASASFGPWQAYSAGFVGAGTGWTKGRPGAGGKWYTKAGMFSMEDRMVQDGWSDPWGVGAGWAAEIHPIEVADFVTGLVTVGFVDIVRDDFGKAGRAQYKIGHRPIDRIEAE